MDKKKDYFHNHLVGIKPYIIQHNKNTYLIYNVLLIFTLHPPRTKSDRIITWMRFNDHIHNPTMINIMVPTTLNVAITSERIPFV